MVTIKEAGELLGYSRITIHRWINLGLINTVPFGMKRKITMSEIERLKLKYNL